MKSGLRPPSEPNYLRWGLGVVSFQAIFLGTLINLFIPWICYGLRAEKLWWSVFVFASSLYNGWHMVLLHLSHPIFVFLLIICSARRSSRVSPILLEHECIICWQAKLWSIRRMIACTWSILFLFSPIFFGRGDSSYYKGSIRIFLENSSIHLETSQKHFTFSLFEIDSCQFFHHYSLFWNSHSSVFTESPSGDFHLSSSWVFT